MRIVVERAALVPRHRNEKSSEKSVGLLRESREKRESSVELPIISTHKMWTSRAARVRTSTKFLAVRTSRPGGRVLHTVLDDCAPAPGGRWAL